MKKVIVPLFFFTFYTISNAQVADTVVKKTSLTNLKEALENPDEVFTLNLSRQGLKEIPKEVFQLKNLRVLHVNFNEITEIPPEISNLKLLVELEINHNKINSISNELFKLGYLTELELGYNNLSKIPKEIKKLTNLTEFEIGDNQIAQLPEELFELDRLTEMDLSNNQLSEIPADIYKMKNLYSLNLGYNNIRNIPETISRMYSLKELRLNNNSISSLPQTLFDTKLDVLILANNPLFNLSNMNIVEYINVTENDANDFILSLMGYSEFEVAERYFHFAFENIVNMDKEDEIAKYYLLGARMYRNINDFEEAQVYSKKCIDICKKYSNNTYLRIEDGHLFRVNLNNLRNEAQLIDDFSRLEIANSRIRQLLNIVFGVLILTFAAITVIIYKNSVKRRKANIELVRKNNKIKRQHAEIENISIRQKELLATKDKFFSIIGHDLKSPISSIIGLTEFVLNNPDKEVSSNKQTIELLNGAAKQAFNLLNNLLAWARSQTGKIKYQPEYFYIDEIIKNNMELLHSLYENKSISVKVAINSKTPVYADKKMIDTVVRNVFNNAIKFTESSGEVRFFSTIEDDYFVLHIADNGIGMSNNTQKRLFKIGKHEIIPGTGGEQGTGLGLIVCDEFIQRNNGFIEIKSKLGEGSEFKLFLPLNKVAKKRAKLDLVYEESVA